MRPMLMRQACFLTMELKSSSECVANGRRRVEGERKRERGGRERFTGTHRWVWAGCCCGNCKL